MMATKGASGKPATMRSSLNRDPHILRRPVENPVVPEKDRAKVLSMLRVITYKRQSPKS